MTISKKIAQIALVLSTLPVAALAGDAGTLYTQIGTGGLGIGYATSINKDWAVRGQYNTATASFSDSSGVGSTAKGELKFETIQFLADWYPSDGGFRLTGGLVVNNSKITFSGTGTVNNVAGATVDGSVKMSDSLSPYLGLGYATKPKDAKGFGFTFDVGVMAQNPKADLTATGAGVTATDIATEKAKMQDAADKLKIWPVLGLGISYSF